MSNSQSGNSSSSQARLENYNGLIQRAEALLQDEDQPLAQFRYPLTRCSSYILSAIDVGRRNFFILTAQRLFVEIKGEEWVAAQSIEQIGEAFVNLSLLEEDRRDVTPPKWLSPEEFFQILIIIQESWDIFVNGREYTSEQDPEEFAKALLARDIAGYKEAEDEAVEGGGILPIQDWITQLRWMPTRYSSPRLGVGETDWLNDVYVPLWPFTYKVEIEDSAGLPPTAAELP